MPNTCPPRFTTPGRDGFSTVSHMPGECCPGPNLDEGRTCRHGWPLNGSAGYEFQRRIAGDSFSYPRMDTEPVLSGNDAPREISMLSQLNASTRSE